MSALNRLPQKPEGNADLQSLQLADLLVHDLTLLSAIVDLSLEVWC